MLLKFSARGNLNALLLRIILQAYITFLDIWFLHKKSTYNLIRASLMYILKSYIWRFQNVNDLKDKNLMIIRRISLSIYLRTNIEKYMNIFNFFFHLDKDSRGRLLKGSSHVVTIENIDCLKTICSADVVLVSSLEQGKVYK